MTAPRDGEAFAEVLALHQTSGIDMGTPRQYTARGGWNIVCACGTSFAETGDEDAESRRLAHIAAALLASHALAELVARERAEALREAAEDAASLGRGVLLGKYDVAHWLRDHADQITTTTTEEKS